MSFPRGLWGTGSFLYGHGRGLRSDLDVAIPSTDPGNGADCGKTLVSQSGGPRHDGEKVILPASTRVVPRILPLSKWMVEVQTRCVATLVEDLPLRRATTLPTSQVVILSHSVGFLV